MLSSPSPAEPRSTDAAHECLRLQRVGGHRSWVAVDADEFAKRRRAQIQAGEQLRPVPTQVRLKAVEPGLVARLGNLQSRQSDIEFAPLLPRLLPDPTDPLQVQPPNQLGGLAPRVEDAHAQLLALLLIQENQAAWDAFERPAGPYWAQDEPGMLRALRLHLAACAGSRLGHGEQARTLWLQALDLHPVLGAAQVNLSAIGRDGSPPAYPELLDQGQAFSIGWIKAIRKGGEDGFDDRFDGLSASYAYLEAAYLGGESVVRKLVSLLLIRRLTAQPDAGQGQRGVEGILRDLANLPIGTSQKRLGFLTALRKAGLIAPDEAAQFWNGTEVREVAVVDTEINRASEPSDLPDDLQDLFEETLLWHRAGRIGEAEVGLNAILARVPDHQASMGNLAGIRVAQGRG